MCSSASKGLLEHPTLSQRMSAWYTEGYLAWLISQQPCEVEIGLKLPREVYSCDKPLRPYTALNLNEFLLTEFLVVAVRILTDMKTIMC